MIQIKNRLTGVIVLEIETLINADLRGANLSYADLRGANLSDADLSYANLSDANGCIPKWSDDEPTPVLIQENI